MVSYQRACPMINPRVVRVRVRVRVPLAPVIFFLGMMGMGFGHSQISVVMFRGGTADWRAGTSMCEIMSDPSNYTTLNSCALKYVVNLNAQCF